MQQGHAAGQTRLCKRSSFVCRVMSRSGKNDARCLRLRFTQQPSEHAPSVGSILHTDILEHRLHYAKGIVINSRLVKLYSLEHDSAQEAWT